MSKTRRLPSSWLFVLVPFSTVVTSLVFALLKVVTQGKEADLLRALNVGDLKSLSYLVYGLGVFGALLILRLLLRDRGLTLKDIGLRSTISLKEVAFSLAAFVVAFILYLPVQRLTALLNIPMLWADKSSQANLTSPTDIVMTFLGAVVLGVIGEDFIFRGYLLSMFEERWNKAATVTAAVILFSLIHLPLGPGITLYMVPWALISCFLFLRFRSVLPCILFHALNNFVAYLVLPALTSR
jgi:membrane protease YdiL (CAAX protease family)